jgi:circadian clock protein KaiC
LPRGKATLVTGGPGCGKTVFGLQTVANGALLYNEPGIFVAFEENSRQIIANAAGFGWNLGEVEDLFFLDAMLHPDTIAIGEFGFSGMLELLGAKARAMKAKRIVLDSLDVLLHLLPGATEKRREMNRLHSWLVENELSATITAKLDCQGADPLFFEKTGLQRPKIWRVRMQIWSSLPTPPLMICRSRSVPCRVVPKFLSENIREN